MNQVNYVRNREIQGCHKLPSTSGRFLWVLPAHIWALSIPAPEIDQDKISCAQLLAPNQPHEVTESTSLSLPQGR